MSVRMDSARTPRARATRDGSGRDGSGLVLIEGSRSVGDRPPQVGTPKWRIELLRELTRGKLHDLTGSLGEQADLRAANAEVIAQANRQLDEVVSALRVVRDRPALQVAA